MLYPYPYEPAGNVALYPIYSDESWNFTEKLHGLTGPIVEVAGPTDIGYYWLNGVEMPRTVHVTNVDGARPRYDAEPYTSKEITEIADVRSMPWTDQTVGMLLCSCLNIVNSEHYEEYIRRGEDMSAELNDEWANRVTQANHMTERIAIGLASLSKADPNMLRLSFIKEALRVLIPGGLVIVRGVTSSEIAIMQRYGFTLRRLIDDSSVSSTGKIDSIMTFSAVLSRD